MYLRAQVADFGMTLPIEPGQMCDVIWDTVDYQAPEQLIENGIKMKKLITLSSGSSFP